VVPHPHSANAVPRWSGRCVLGTLIIFSTATKTVDNHNQSEMSHALFLTPGPVSARMLLMIDSSEESAPRRTKA